MMTQLFDSPASLIIIVITTGTSFIAFRNPELWQFMALVPFRMFREREFHEVVTSGFVHANGPHLLVNMLTLFFFGPVTEHLLGGTQFLAVYGASLVIGSLWPLAKHRNDPGYVAIGASGAVSGIVFAFCLFEPTHLLYLFFAIPIPAILFAVLYVAYSVYAMKRMNDNIGHEAHIAGALGGVLLTIILHPEVINRFAQRMGEWF